MLFCYSPSTDEVSRLPYTTPTYARKQEVLLEAVSGSNLTQCRLHKKIATIVCRPQLHNHTHDNTNTNSSFPKIPSYLKVFFSKIEKIVATLVYLYAHT